MKLSERSGRCIRPIAQSVNGMLKHLLRKAEEAKSSGLLQNPTLSVYVNTVFAHCYCRDVRRAKAALDAVRKEVRRLVAECNYLIISQRRLRAFLSETGFARTIIPPRDKA